MSHILTSDLTGLLRIRLSCQNQLQASSLRCDAIGISLMFDCISIIVGTSTTGKISACILFVVVSTIFISTSSGGIGRIQRKRNRSSCASGSL